MPRVTVIIPSYNHEKYVAYSIQSVLNQTYHDFEVVITDDGSSDGTVREIKRFSDPRIRLFAFDKNQGACVAANKCVREARGEYIAMLSSDDIFLPDKLEKQVDFLDKHPEIMTVFGYARIIDENGNDFADENHFYFNIFEQPNRTRFEWLNNFFYKGNCLCHPSALIRKRCYEELGLYNERLAQVPDLEFWVRMCLRYDIHVMPEYLVKFRIRAGKANASGGRLENILRNSFELTKILQLYLGITSTEYLNIFPDAGHKEKIDEEMIPFLVARRALESKEGKNVYHNFAINTIYTLLGDEKIAEKLRENYDFSCKDFLRLTGSGDSLDSLQLFLDQLEEKDRQLKEILNSGSWRITKPLRTLLGFFK